MDRVDKIVAAVALVAMLFLVGRGVPRRHWPVAIAGTLAVILIVVLAERSGYWPREWRVR